MKFVTVMDMWLLLINICLMGSIIYFGKKLIKTMTRFTAIAEKREENPERLRIIKIIEDEIDIYTQASMMTSSRQDEVVIALENVLDRVKRK